MKIIDFSVKNSQFTFILFVGVLLLGGSALMNMPRSEDPIFSPPGFSVVHVMPGASPLEIEEQITKPIEDRLGELENIDRVFSNSSDGLSLITIEFNFDQNTDTKFQDVVREVNALQNQLPKEIYRSEIRRFAASDVSILQTALVSENASFGQFDEASERLEKSLEKVPGIKRAEVWGVPEKQVEISLNLPKMAQLGIPVARLLQILESENLSIPGGPVNVGARKFNVQTSGDYASVDEIRNTQIFTAGGKTVFLKDIAEVNNCMAEPTHICRVNGHRAVFVTAALKDGENISAVGKTLNSTLDEFNATRPANLDFVKIFDQNRSVSTRLSHLGLDFIIAILLVAFTLLPLGLRAAAVVMISIPLSLAIGVASLDFLGYNLNQLSIVGFIVALGILVDDSIVVVENIERWLREGHSRVEASILATKQIGLAVLGCTATLVLAFLPIVFLPGASGDFIRSLPMAVIVTIVASMIVSLTVVPFLASRMLSSHENPKGNLFLRGLKWMIGGSYARLLTRALHWPWLTMAVTVAIFAGVMMLAGSVGFSLFPESEKPMFYMNIETPPGTNLQETNRVATRVDSVLKKYLTKTPEIGWKTGEKGQLRSFATNVGMGNPRIYYNVIPKNEDPVFGQIFCLMPEGSPPKVKLALINDLRLEFANWPGAKVEVRNFEQGPPVPAPVNPRIFGDNLDTLRQLANQVEQIVLETPGSIYVSNPFKTITTDLRVHINKEKAAMLGIPSAEIDRTVRLAVAGLETGRFTDEDGEKRSIVVRLPHVGTPDLSVFKSLNVNSLSGASIPLSQVAELDFVPTASEITHWNSDRYVAIASFVKPGFLSQNINAALEKRLPEIRWPVGYHFELAGDEENKKRSFGGMGTIVGITIFGFLAVLILEFRTFKSTLIVLSVIPLGVIGAVFALLFSGYTFSFTAVIGLIALVGIEVKNSILLVDFTNHLREEGMELDAAIQEAGEIRFVPIVLTSLTAIGGLLPLAIERNPLYSPLAMVIIGGLISSTLLSRIVTPVLYKLLAPRVAVKS